MRQRDKSYKIMKRICYPRLAICDRFGYGNRVLVICQKDKNSQSFKVEDFSGSIYYVSRRELKFISNKSKGFKTAIQKADDLQAKLNRLNLAICNNSK